MEHYQLVTDKLETKLETHVNTLMSEGWLPTGGIYIVVDPFRTTRYYQAMYKA